MDCTYEAGEGETRTKALKRKYNDLQNDNDRYRGLYEFIRRRPASEAQVIFNRIRASQNPLEVFRSIQDADLLLFRTPSDMPGEVDPRLQKIDQEALQKAPIKVHAGPWTRVAGDGIVSELISAFFEVESLYFFASVYRDAFVHDMNQCEPHQAKYCSPLLVNAMCGFRCVSILESFRDNSLPEWLAVVRKGQSRKSHSRCRYRGTLCGREQEATRQGGWTRIDSHSDSTLLSFYYSCRPGHGSCFPHVPLHGGGDVEATQTGEKVLSTASAGQGRATGAQIHFHSLLGSLHH